MGRKRAGLGGEGAPCHWWGCLQPGCVLWEHGQIPSFPSSNPRDGRACLATMPGLVRSATGNLGDAKGSLLPGRKLSPTASSTEGVSGKPSAASVAAPFGSGTPALPTQDTETLLSGFVVGSRLFCLTMPPESKACEPRCRSAWGTARIGHHPKIILEEGRKINVLYLHGTLGSSLLASAGVA